MSEIKRVDLQPAFVLHRRPYRETSVILELFTPSYGRISAIAKGVRKAKSATQGILQPFMPLIVSWSGRNELMTLTSIEMQSQALKLRGRCLYAGFYINELILALLQKWDAHTDLYDAYQEALIALQTDELNEAVLRRFEKILLSEIGYGLLLAHDHLLDQQLSEKQSYRYQPEEGFVPCESTGGLSVFTGKELLQIAKEDWSQAGVLSAAKRLIRLVMMPLLGKKQINSRQLFARLEEVG